MSFLSAREHGAKPGSGGVASAQQEVSVRLLYVCAVAGLWVACCALWLVLCCLALPRLTVLLWLVHVQQL